MGLHHAQNFTTSSNSSQTNSSWFFSFQESFDSRTLSKLILSFLIIIFLFMVSYLIVKISRRFCCRRPSHPPPLPPPSPVYSISSDPRLIINNISVIINSSHCGCSSVKCSDYIRAMKEKGEMEYEEHILKVVKDYLENEFG